jgi:two-component system cell cycle sensor histidine kinase PleC
MFPVVEAGHPIGLVNRHDFVHAMAQKYGRALYDKRPITALMDDSPLVVDVATPLETLNRLIVDEKPTALLEGFIVTRDDSYVGIGTALSLLQYTNNLIHARARELEDARRLAEQANIAKSRFLATMSHEFRTPMNAVMGFSELIANESYGPISDARYVEYANLIRESGEHLLTIIDDVLDMSRIEAGKLSLNESPFDPLSLVRRCIALLEPQARESEIGLSCHCPAIVPDLFGDEHKMQQVLFNLISNAIKFTPPGGDVRVRMTHTESEFIFAVVDTGIGVAADDIPRILEPFVQVEADDCRKYGGTGLGLPLTKSLVELHDGILEFTSTKAVGTTVTVRLPAARIVVGGKDAHQGRPALREVG